MQALPLDKAFTLIEPGPVALVTTHDGVRSNVMTISWTMVTDCTSRFAITTGAWNHPLPAKEVGAPLIRECLANIESRVVDIVSRHGIFVLEGLATCVDTARKERRTLHAVGDGTFIADGRRLDRRRQMASKLPPGV